LLFIRTFVKKQFVQPTPIGYGLFFLIHMIKSDKYDNLIRIDFHKIIALEMVFISKAIPITRIHCYVPSIPCFNKYVKQLSMLIISFLYAEISDHIPAICYE